MAHIIGLVYINGNRSKDISFKAKVRTQADLDYALSIFKKDGFDTYFRLQYKKGEKILYC